MNTKWDRKVPFGLKHDGTRYMLEYSSPWGPEPDWVENYTFEDELEVVGWRKGRSKVRFDLKSTTTGVVYSTGLSTFYSLVPSLQAGRIRGVWTFKKQGSNFSLVKVGV